MRSPRPLYEWVVPVALCLGALAPAAPAARAADAGPVVVTLRPGADVTASPVCVGNVASLSGGSAALRGQIAGLDLIDRPRQGKALPLVRELVAYRIQVAGIGRDRFRVEGAALVVIRAGPGSVTEDDFLLAAHDALLDTLPFRRDEVTVALAQPLRLAPVELAPKDEVRLDAEPHPPLNVPGRVRVDVTLRVNGERLGVVPVVVEVKVYQPVAVAVRHLDGGEALTDENVRFERRMIDAAGSYVTPKEFAAGLKAKKPMALGQVILHGGVDGLSDANPVLVKQRDTVKLVARVGSVSVTALGEAEQDGRAGDRVRVRNVDSHKEIVGRVTARGLVEVEY